MNSPWPHRCAILLAAAAFLCVLSGTAVTTNEERPFYSVGQSHLWLGAAMAVLAIVLILSMRWNTSLQGKWGWLALAAVAVQALLGLQPLPQAPAVRIAHVFVALLFIPLAVAFCFFTSARWRTAPKPVAGPSALLLLANCVPLVVLAQVALGVLFRHGAMGVGPHLIGAFLVAFFILGLGLPVIYRPELSSLHLAARIFLTIASVQVFLGLALFSMGFMDLDPRVVILTTMIHAATGALTLAATVMMGILIRRNLSIPCGSPVGIDSERTER